MSKQKRKPKLLVIASTFPKQENDKTPSFVYNLAKQHTSKYEVHVVCPHSYKSKSYEEMGGMKVHRFRYFLSKYQNLSSGISISDTIRNNKLNLLLVPLYIFTGSFKIFTLLLKHKFDVVHNHWLIPFSPVTAFLKKFFNYQLVLTSHGGDILGFPGKITYHILKKLFQYSTSRTDYYTVVSRDMKKVAQQRFHLKPKKGIKIISMGIPYDMFAKVKPSFSKNDFTVAFFGRLSEIKGTKYLIEAIALLSKKESTKVRCKIIGDGPLREDLEKQCEENGIKDLVKFTGFVPQKDVPKLLNRTGAFIGPSITTSTGYKEGFGLVFVEAMAAGLPVIASRSGGITDTVKHKVTGLLVEEKDYKQIAKYIIEVRDNIPLRDSLITNGKKLAKEYSWESIGKKYADLYTN